MPPAKPDTEVMDGGTEMTITPFGWLALGGIAMIAIALVCEGWELVATAFQGANEHTLLLPTPSDKEGGL